MNSQKISKLIAAKGYSVSLVAEAIDRTPGLVSKVINRKAKSHYAAQAIAKVLNLPVCDIFPDVPEYAYGKVHSLSSEEKAKKVAELRKLLEK